MKVWKYGNGRVSRPTSRVLAALAVSIFACSSSVAFAKEDCAAPDGITLRLKAVAVGEYDDMQGENANFVSPDTRIVVPDDKHQALFRVDYEIPEGVDARIGLSVNCDDSRTRAIFCTSPSSLHSGTGTVVRLLYVRFTGCEKSVLVKSVRLFVSIKDENDKNGDRIVHYIGDAPVDVLFANEGAENPKDCDVMEPLPPPPPVSTSLLPGWTEDFDAAKARAKKEGKLILAYFPGVVIFDPSQELVARLDSDGWEGGVDGYLAKIERECKAGLDRREEEKKAWAAAREKAKKTVPPKTDATSTPAGFTDNLDEALAKAKAEGKFVYACFTGSDWCVWCKMLEKEVLSDPAFVASVMDDYVLVYIDSPRNEDLLSVHAKAANGKLTETYGIEGFPTALILDGDGKRLGKTGYRNGGAAKYAAYLMAVGKHLKQKEKENVRK